MSIINNNLTLLIVNHLDTYMNRIDTSVLQ